MSRVRGVCYIKVSTECSKCTSCYTFLQFDGLFILNVTVKLQHEVSNLVGGGLEVAALKTFIGLHGRLVGFLTARKSRI